VVGLLGEFDALPQLSQKADLTRPEPENPGAPGHGCGHHLLGAGCMQAAVAVKDYLLEHPCQGTVIYYGCPAEEGGAGKAFMVREGCFEDCDVCLAWHPYSATFASVSSLANARIIYNFTGKSAHAAAAPHLGRSALDAVELMNVGVNYMREHMLPEARVHYAVTDTGGDAPNVVQARAQVLYSVRAPRTDQVYELAQRVHNIARGAALMTETQVDIQVVSSYADVLQNKTLDGLVYRHMQEVFPLSYTEEELAYAQRFHEVGDPGDWKAYQAMAVKLLGEKGRELFQGAMADVCVPPMPLKTGSTDVGDVSWNVPTAWFGSACFALGTPAHSWLAVAQGKSAIAHRGMAGAAMVLARTALDLMEQPQLVDSARADMERAKGGAEYQTLIPTDVKAGSF
jgi:aminobenzoyl-glutamate utilization protein B